MSVKPGSTNGVQTRQVVQTPRMHGATFRHHPSDLGRIALTISMAAVVTACGIVPLPGGRWKVDIVNGTAPVIVSITTEAVGWAWLIEPDGRLVLLDLPTAPSGGEITIIRPGADCEVLQELDLTLTSFTLVEVLDGDGIAFDTRPGAPLAGVPSLDFEGGCSG
jgi:hypothetical protein